jgi:Uncharacterized protein, possibly involved in aromatic compounds catabolism
MLASAIMSEPKNSAVPAGFKLLVRDRGFIAHVGPLYIPDVPGRAGDRDAAVIGFRVDERHCNLNGTLHGGMLMTLADILLIYAARRDLGHQDFMPTISLAGDFLAPVRVGDWVEGQAGIVRATGNICCVEGILRVGNDPVARFNTLLRLPKGKA